MCGREWESGDAHALCIVVYHGLQSEEETAVAVARPDFFVEPPPVDRLHADRLTEIPRPPPAMPAEARTPFKIPLA